MPISNQNKKETEENTNNKAKPTRSFPALLNGLSDEALMRYIIEQYRDEKAR